MSSLISFFRSRVVTALRRWPPSMQREVRKYLGVHGRGTGADARLDADRHDQPYWLILPYWMAEVFRGKSLARTVSRSFMRDILWGQYCLYVFIRIQDDLFDGHTNRLWLIYASDGFLLEAERVFSIYFRRSSSFWGIYRECILETITAIADADELERKPVKDRERLLAAHGATSAICNIAPAAFCLKAGRMRDFQRLSVYSTEMMKTGAIADDLLDMYEDLDRGRFNYAMSFFLQSISVGRSSKERVRRQIARNILVSDGLTRVFRDIHRHLDLAERAIAPFAVRSARKYLRSFRKSMARMEDGIHRRRVQTIFGGDEWRSGGAGEQNSRRTDRPLAN